MSASSSQCAARPVVPPKPEKDKISSPILGGSSPTSSATASAVSSPEGIGSRSSPRQTVGTQVNFMLRKPSSSSVAASSSSASRFPSDGPSTTTTENSESTTTKTSKVNITSPKPALPPKPSASAFKKGSTSPQIQKFNSSTSTSTTTNTDQLISSSVSPVHNNHQNNNDSQTDNQNQKIEQDQRIIRNVQLKTVNGSVEVGTAPVAHIEELDNLSDLNSPSPVRHKEISSPPSSQHHHHPPMKDIVSALNTKFGNFDGGRVNAPPAVVNKKPYKPPIPPPPFLHHAATSGVPKNFLHSNIPPPVSPRRAHHTAPTTTTTDINRFPSVGVGRGQVFQFPPNNSISTNNNNINSSHTSFFTPQQIQQRQAKSASLGRTAPTSFTSNFKKSTTLSRVAPLDLISTTVKGPSISTVHTAPVLGLSSNKKPGSLPLTPAFHFRPVASSSDKCSSVPPPPPPRMRRSQRGLSLTAGQQNIIDGKSPTSPTSPTSPGFDSMGIPDKPVYATVDKEKKWAARLQKQNSEGSHQHQNEISSAENEIETTVKKSSSDNEESACESIVNSSLTITTSWLGRKFIDSGAVSETTTTTTMTENSTSGGGVISSGSFNNQVDSVSSIEAARNGVTHEAVHINNINFSNDNNMHSNIYNSTVQQHQHRQQQQQQQQQQPHHLIYNSPSNNNIDSDKTTPQHSVASSSMNNNNENFNTRDEEGEVVVVEQMITNNNNNKQKQPTTEKNEQKENMNDSPSSLVQPQVQSEKDGLCRNKSFLYAMQDTNLKLDQLDRVQEEVVPYNEIDNIALKEINLSSTAATVDGGSGDKDNNTHPAAAAIITKTTTTTTAPHHHHHVAECEVEEINQNPFWDISSRSISGNSNNSKLTSNSNSNLAQQDHTNNTTAREAASNEKNSQQQQHPPPPHENKSMDTIKVSVIPNRESVLDVFERELEIQLESLESFCASQTVDPLSPSSVSANFNDDGQSQVSTSSRSSSMAASAAAAVSQKPDPSKFLELVDSRLQSMQNLLENIATSPTRRGFPSSGSDNNNSVPSNSQSFEEGRCVPLGFEIPGMGEYMEMESGETGSSQSSTRRLTDGDIVTDIVLSSKRFEGSGLVLSSRRSVTGSTEPDVNGRGGTTTAAEEETSAVNIVVECGQNEEEGTSVDIDLPQLKANSGSNNNSNLDTGTDVDGTSPFQRRSWNLSDYSPSPSDSSSTSSGRSRPNNHQRRSCDFSAADSTPGGGGSHGRRKQVSSSWIDIGEDELSGALGDAESSDALVPSSTEDIERSHGHPVEKVTRRKRGIVSLFGSFGKSGSSSSHSPQFPTQNRSQFFLDDSPSNLESTESHHHHPHHPQERRDHRDKTRSLPAGSPVNVFDVPRRPHRALQRTSPSSAGAQLTMSFDEASQMRSNNNNNDNSEQNSSATSAVAAVAKSATVMIGAVSAITTILGDSENSSSARSSICYDEVLADLSTKQRKAFFVARELLTSERSFVDVLNLLTVDFPLALKLTSDTIRMPVIGSSDLDFILGGLPTLKAVNEVLMNELEERIAGWKENPKIADIIVKTGPFLKHYSTYVRDFERIVQRLDHCCAKYPSFARALREFEANDRCQKLGLKHYMLKPVQRMPQYRLLLEDYLKTLDETCEDYNDTVKAIAIVKEVAEHANEAINLQINAEKLMTLQNRLPNIIVLRTNRFLLKEGELLKVCRKELQPRYFALMTDVLLCMTYNASSGSNMKDLKLRYDLPLAGMRCSSKFEDYANEFSVISTTRSFSLVAKSARERDEWMKALSLAIQDNIKKRACTTPDFEKEFRIGAEAPVWIQDKRVSMCQVCTAEFTVTFRRHHCRACGKCVCGNCSGNQAPLQYLDNAAARVCEGCYQHLLEEFDRENCEKNTDSINEIRGRFRKLAINSSRANRQRKSIPDKFKIPEAINSESRISGYLQCREKKSWKRHWFVLMDRVLYVYAASEDIVAMRTLPVLGYQIEPVSEEVYPGVDPQLMFRLTHSGVSNPLVFMAENYSAAEKWMTALQEATVLT